MLEVPYYQMLSLIKKDVALAKKQAEADAFVEVSLFHMNLADFSTFAEQMQL